MLAKFADLPHKVKEEIRGLDEARRRIAELERQIKHHKGASAAIGLGKTKRVPCPHLVRIEPRAPDDHLAGLSRGVFVELGKPLVLGVAAAKPALNAVLFLRRLDHVSPVEMVASESQLC